MSSSISPADTNVFEQPANKPSAYNAEVNQPLTQKNKKDINDTAVSADKKLSNEVSVSEQQEELEKVSLTDSFNKMFGQDSTISLLQSRSLEFSVGEHKGKTVVKVIDKDSKDVIRQIPSEEFIKMAQRIDSLSDEMQKTRGVLLDKQV